MRTRDKVRLVRAFLAGESICELTWRFRRLLALGGGVASCLDVEAAIRDALRPRRDAWAETREMLRKTTGRTT